MSFIVLERVTSAGVEFSDPISILPLAQAVGDRRAKVRRARILVRIAKDSQIPEKRQKNVHYV